MSNITDNNKQSNENKDEIDKSNYLKQLSLDVKNGNATQKELLEYYSKYLGELLLSSVEVNGHMVMSKISRCAHCDKMHQEHEHIDCDKS